MDTVASPNMPRSIDNHRLQIIDIPISDVKFNFHNPRRHSERQIHMLAGSIKMFGFLVPVLIDDDNTLMTGEARAHAALEAGLTEIPAICISHLSPAERRAFTIADNRLSEKATWDAGQLAVELNFLAKFDVEFDFGCIGFETAEIDIILDEET